VGRAGTAEHVERIVRGWRRVDRKAEAEEAARRHKSRALHVYQDEDGQALAAARETLYRQTKNVPAGTRIAGALPATGLIVSEDTPPLGQQQADALALLAETALHHGIDPGTPGERYQVVVHVNAPVLADQDAPGQSVLEDGTHVFAETSRRLACDASRVVMRHDPDGRVTEVGARTRPTAARPRCRTSRCSVAGTTARFTRRAGSASIRGRPCPAGWANGWMSGMRSTSCTRWPRSL
jgi:hypothetical protein